MKLAFIGTGKIIADALFAVEPVKNIEKTAVFARPHSRAKAEALAEKYNIREIYTDYQELLEKTEADTVYIGLIISAPYLYSGDEKDQPTFYADESQSGKIGNIADGAL